MEKHFCHCLLPPSCFRLSIYISICPRRRTEVYKRFTVKLKCYPNSLGSIKTKKISKQKSIWMVWVCRKVFKFCISHRILLPFKFTLLLATLIDSLISFTITFWWFIVHTIVNLINVELKKSFNCLIKLSKEQYELLFELMRSFNAKESQIQPKCITIIPKMGLW